MKAVILMGLLFCWLGVEAQLVNGGVAISQTDGILITVQNMDVENNGNWTNDGILNLTDNWSGSGAYRFGQLNLLGQDQTLSGDLSMIDDLYVMGGGLKAFDQQVSIFNSLHLLNGVASMRNGSSLSLLDEADLVGGSADSFISGLFSQAGSGDLYFPIGVDSEYRPVTLTDVGEGEELIGMQAGQTTLSFGTTLTEIAGERSWNLTSADREIGGIVLPVLNQEYINASSEITLAYSEGADPFEALPGGQFDGSMDIATIALSQNVSAGTYALGKQSDVGPPIMVVNVVTANNDGKHDYLRIDNIDFYDGNQVEIYNRAGQKVFEMSDYDNHERVFEGRGNVGGNNDLLLTGSYFYSIRLGKKKVETGFIYVKTQ